MNMDTNTMECSCRLRKKKKREITTEGGYSIDRKDERALVVSKKKKICSDAFAQGNK